MSEIRLLLADVDGTLVTHDKVLTPRAIAAVAKLRDAGIKFAITSGRPPRGMAMLIEPLGIDTPVAGFNGGQFVKPDLSLIEAHTLPREAAERAVTLIAKAGLDVWVYAGEDWLVHDDKAPHIAREQWTVKFAPTVTKEFGAALDRAVKIVGVSDDLELVARTEHGVRDALGESASAARSQPYYLDVTHHDANKGGVVAYLARTLDIAADSIATIGDQPNDMLMFQAGGMAIAMGNANAEVQSAADHVTASSEEEGFAVAVEQFILGAKHG